VYIWLLQMLSLTRMLHSLCFTTDSKLLCFTIGYNYSAFARCLLIGLVYLLLVHCISLLVLVIKKLRWSIWNITCSLLSSNPNLESRNKYIMKILGMARLLNLQKCFFLCAWFKIWNSLSVMKLVVCRLSKLLEPDCDDVGCFWEEANC
jgi:hypothetical protein